MATLGTRLLTWWRGELAGTDQFGNRYYRERGGDRRWVLYRGVVEASKVPPEWNAWLHKTSDAIPSADVKRRPWQMEHQPNLTGTAAAYRPPGHVGGARAPATGDYQAWQPD
jgi:NADH:ubiquinone oxidoreductase subunit